MRRRLLAVLLCLAAPAGAECRLALALAVDVSRSIDAADFVIQTEGLADALNDRDVRAALFGPEGTVALAVYQWSGPSHQEIIVPWVMLEGPEALDRAIWSVRRAQRPERKQATALGEALRFGADLLAEAPPCARLVLDVAGDGRNNEGVSVARVYARDPFDGITVNGLAIGEHEQDVARYYRDEVIRGPGAFVEVAPRQVDYPPVIRRKLLRELEGPKIGQETGAAGPGGKT
jgi:Protein of unknown function (DUF1194)